VTDPLIPDLTNLGAAADQLTADLLHHLGPHFDGTVQIDYGRLGGNALEVTITGTATGVSAVPVEALADEAMRPEIIAHLARPWVARS
jgi:hypothetical protein